MNQLKLNFLDNVISLNCLSKFVVQIHQLFYNCTIILQERSLKLTNTTPTIKYVFGIWWPITNFNIKFNKKKYLIIRINVFKCNFHLYKVLITNKNILNKHCITFKIFKFNHEVINRLSFINQYNFVIFFNIHTDLFLLVYICLLKLIVNNDLI